MGIREIVIPYAPRAEQRSIHEALLKNRFVVAVAHRRLGKTVSAVNHLIRSAVECGRERPRFAYVAPTYTQAKAVAWDYLKHYTRPIPGAVVNESELRVDFLDRRIRLFGADNPDSLRGQYFDGVVLDETGLMKAQVWGEVIRPALADRMGWALFIGTPNGHNAFHDLAEASKTTDGWRYLEFKASETGIVPFQELEAAKKTMTADEYAQEFECSFEAAIQGAIFGDQLNQARCERRIANVPYTPEVRVDTFWDLGVGDATAIWFAQRVGMEIRLIDYYEASGEGLPHYADMLDRRRYTYGTHYAPHDIAVRELGTGKSRLETAASLGIDFETVPQLPLEDGIHAARMIFNRCWFDASKCKDGVECLSNYRWDYNRRLDEFKTRPVHDWSSHGADAFRYMAVSLRERQASKPIKRRGSGMAV